MRTYLGPIGFNPTSVTRPILSHGLENGDAVMLVRPDDETDDRRAEETLADIKRNIGALEPNVSVTIKRIPHDDFQTAVLQCRGMIREASGRRILILGGGARDVLIPLTIAGLATANSISMVLNYSDIDGAVRELDLPNLTASISESAKETLRAIEQTDSASLAELEPLVNHSKSTITRHVNHLNEQGLIETWREGREKHVRMTMAGKLILE